MLRFFHIASIRNSPSSRFPTSLKVTSSARNRWIDSIVEEVVRTRPAKWGRAARLAEAASRHPILGAPVVFMLLFWAWCLIGWPFSFLAQASLPMVEKVSKIFLLVMLTLALINTRRKLDWLILAMVALHVVAIVVYRVKRGRDLVTPMIVGDKLLPAGVPAARDTLATRALALALVAACAALAGWVASLGA